MTAPAVILTSASISGILSCSNFTVTSRERLPAGIVTSGTTEKRLGWFEVRNTSSAWVSARLVATLNVIV